MGEPKKPVTYDPRMDMSKGSEFDPPKPERRRRRRWIAIPAVAAVAAIGAYLAFFGSPGADEDKYDPNNSSEAIAQCENLVSTKLKSPSTAKYNSTTTSTESGLWTVKGTVDSQNSFGAVLRTTYQCSVRVTGDKIERRLDQIG